MNWEVLLAAALLVLGMALLGWGLRKKLAATQSMLGESFKALSFEIMEKNNRSFLDLAKASLEKYQEGAKSELEGRQKAIEGVLKQIDDNQRELEKRREGAYAGLVAQIEAMRHVEKDLAKETTRLAQLLRSSQGRGSWGEVHLRRVVEMAGLLNHCDFFEQKSLDGGGRISRPDLIVRLPGERHIAIDAKTPLTAYLDASETIDEENRKKKLMDHAAALRKHIRDLSAKEYWKQLEISPEYVILFLPAEAFFSAALQADPELIEVGADSQIIVATPTTLIAILRAVAFSWKQDGLSKNAREISRLGQELYDRVGTLCDYWNKVGKNLNTAVEAYNQSVASLESRVLLTARKLKETASLVKELDEPKPLEKLARPIQDINVDL